MLEDCYFDIQ